jgi:hypothetical protein
LKIDVFDRRNIDPYYVPEELNFMHATRRRTCAGRPAMVLIMRILSLLLAAVLLTGCFTDAATRLGFDLKAGAGRVGREDGSRYTIEHRTPSSRGECTDSYTVQLDKVGAIIIWCKDAQGDKVVSSHSTSLHGRFVFTPQTYILEKQARETLWIELERRNGQVVIVAAR